jgi:uncharacterized metal-binding protein
VSDNIPPRTATVSPLAGYYHSQSCLQLWFLPWQDIITHRAVYNYGFSLGGILSLTELFTTMVSPLAGYYHSQSCLQLQFLPWQDIITHRAVYNYGFSLGEILSLYNYGFSLGRILSLTELFTTTVSPLAVYYHFTTTVSPLVKNHRKYGEIIVVNSSVSDNILPREKP